MVDNEIVKPVEERPLCKYNIIPIKFTPTQEIGVDEVVGSYNKVTGKQYINFIDENGRMWKGLEDDFIVIRNVPTEEDLMDFARLKKETVELENIIKHKKPEELDRAFH